MNKLKITIAFFAVAFLFLLVNSSSFAGGTVQNPMSLIAIEHCVPSVVLAGYRNGGQYCQYRECADYYSCGYYKKCCRYYQYYDCAPYNGGGGYHKKRYYGGGGGGY